MQNLLKQYGFSTSDVDPVKTIYEMSEIASELKNGQMPNITFTEKQLEDPCKLYDLIETSGLFAEVTDVIGELELSNVYNMLMDMVESIYSYNNSNTVNKTILETIQQIS